MADTPAVVKFRINGVPFTYDIDGRPWLYSISIAEPPPAGKSDYVAGSAEWKDGALVMSRAQSLNTDPNRRPVDHLVILPLPGALVAITYIGPDKPNDDEPVYLGEPEADWHTGCTGCWRTIWHTS